MPHVKMSKYELRKNEKYLNFQICLGYFTWKICKETWITILSFIKEIYLFLK